MPSEDIQVKALPAVRVAHADGVAAGFEPASISPVIQPLCDRLCADLDKAGVPMVGPALAWYDDAPGGGVLVHAGMPVQAEPGTYEGSRSPTCRRSSWPPRSCTAVRWTT